MKTMWRDLWRPVAMRLAQRLDSPLRLAPLGPFTFAVMPAESRPR